MTYRTGNWEGQRAGVTASVSGWGSLVKSLSRAFWVEFVAAAASGLLAALTAVWPDWIEGVFGVDPDHHNGSVEWAVVVVCAAVAIVFASLARREWRRLQAASTA
jgi:hypothetical protein